MHRNSSGNYWFLIFLIFIFGGSGIFPTLLLLGLVFALVYAAIKSANGNQAINGFMNKTTNSYGYQERKNGNRNTSSDLAKINIYLRRYFKSHTFLDLPDNIELILRTQRFNSLTSLDVYRNGSRLGTMTEFRNKYGEQYDSMFDTLLSMATNTYTPKSSPIVDAEIVEKNDTPVKEEPIVTPKTEEKKSQYFIQQINDLNDDIPHEDISNGLYETCALLKQVQILESKFPDSAHKMEKMYEYYLPYLVKILEAYENLQTVKSDPNYEKSADQLERTIHSINEALNNIIPTMSDTDFTNLSVDMATLEALLQKDGLTGGMDSTTKQK